MKPFSIQITITLPTASTAILAFVDSSAGFESVTGVPKLPPGGRIATSTRVTPAHPSSRRCHAAIVVPSGAMTGLAWPCELQVVGMDAVTGLSHVGAAPAGAAVSVKTPTVNAAPSSERPDLR